MLENSNEKQVSVKQEAGLPSDALFEAHTEGLEVCMQVK